MTDFRVTQISIEEFGSATPPPMQATQVSLEMWASVTAVNPRMVVTNVALEEWMSVAQLGGTQARVMVMA